MLEQAFLAQRAGLGQAIMGLVNRAIQGVIAEEIVQFVKGDDVMRDEISRNSDVFWVGEISSQIEIGKIDCCPIGVFRNHTIQKNFDCVHLSSDCRSIIRVLYPVAADGEPCLELDAAVSVRFLDADRAHIRDDPVLGNIPE